ncbi:MAG TPA: head GIN domain-containing protein [Candidatus Bathyarchaeia archaeon]|nr:head GIN domain-containing protein [Candidatus Bathyarchaeia archaeon]
MSTKNLVTEKRDVSDFDYLEIREHHEGELTISLGEKESLAIEAPVDMIDRIETTVHDHKLFIKTGGNIINQIGDSFRTSLTRRKIKYILTVKELIGVEISGILKANINDIKSNYFILKFNGVGTIKINSLKARFLDVKLSNLGKIEINGRVEEQKVTIKGSSNYQAQDLLCEKSKIDLNGIGKAIIWVTEELDVSIRGVGSVSYYGAPRIKSHVTPMASLLGLGKR